MFAQKPCTFTLEVLSPLHVGTGETLDPLDYRVYWWEIGRFPCIEIYDLSSVMQRLKDDGRRELEDMVRQNDYVKLRRWLAKEVLCQDDMEDALFRAVAADAEVLEAYNEELEMQRSSLEIHPMMVSPVNGLPIVPGSTIKGALRTAWLNRLVRDRKMTNADDRGFERKLLGDPREDPFRLLAVGDVEFPIESLLVTRVLNVRKGGKVVSARQGGDRTFRMFFECLVPGKSSATSGQGRIAWTGFDQKRNTLKEQIRNGVVPENLEELLAEVRKDAELELNRETEFFESHPAGKHAEDLLKLLRKLSNREALLKLGRFGGVFSKTVEGVRAPKGRRGRDGMPRWGTTRFIAGMTSAKDAPRVSCGWCRLKVG